MGFNYAKEKAKFDRQWAGLRKQYEQLGMSTDSIQKMYEFDLKCFKSQRRYDSHRADLPEGATLEALHQASTGTLPGDIPATFGSDPNCWLDEIENEQLLQKLVLLSRADLTLLTYLVFEGYAQSEIAKMDARSQVAVSKHLKKIRKILG